MLANKICLITGATGIAMATAVEAARQGASMFVVGLHDGQCSELSSLIRDNGGVCEFFVADVSDELAVEGAIHQCVRRFGRIDIAFNVAGISGRRFGDGPVHECSVQGWQTTIDTNARSVFLVSRAVLRVMMAQPINDSGLRGSILNMASVLAFAPRADHFATHAYAASKGAIISLTQSMAAYYAPHKIRVNVIAPGLIRTPMSRRAQDDPRILELMKTKQPLREDLLIAQDVASAAVFLMSDRGGAITGVTLPVDGGWCVSG